ncbi:DUF4267 domain-containing protein [Myxococcus sp. K15C18031901]|uniref:DUF4267 domain-containing protein n=1 Tax=Myxococcus dinghuensis TaxID=2906761 RepID=UPI0020A75927|nr:DUF4267 domain-containing protein [Myxococcus dinghuensis]MCP3097268.1 DUF4267 domain-containing protein [Myxococcus dinghuensis]
MNPTHPASSWKLSSPTAAFTMLLVAFMLFLTLRTVLDPASAATGFGVPYSGPEVIPWLHVKAGRDLGIGLALAGLVALRQRRAAGVFVLASIVMPVVDALTAVREGGTSVAMALAIHGSAASYGVILATALLWKRD